MDTLNDSGSVKPEETSVYSNPEKEDKPNLQNSVLGDKHEQISGHQENEGDPTHQEESINSQLQNDSQLIQEIDHDVNSQTEPNADLAKGKQSGENSPREQRSNLEVEHLQDGKSLLMENSTDDKESLTHDIESKQNESLKEENVSLSQHSSKESRERSQNGSLYQNMERKPRAKDSGFDKWMSSIKPLEEISITKQNLLPPIIPETNGSEKSLIEEQQPIPPPDDNNNQPTEEEKSVLDMIEPVIDENYVAVTHKNPWKKLSLILFVCLFVAVVIIIVLLVLVVYFAVSDRNCTANDMESTTTEVLSSSSVSSSSSYLTTSLGNSISQTTTTSAPSCPSQDLPTYCSDQQYNFTTGCCCYNSPDVILVVDTSSSMLTKQTIVKQFLVDLTSNFTLSASGTAIKFALINTKPTVEWQLGSLITQSNAVTSAAIGAADFTTGDSTFTAAYQVVIDQMLTSANGDRANVPNVIVTIGDGDMTTTGLSEKVQALQNVTKLLIGVYTGSGPQNLVNVVTSTSSSLFTINQVDMVIDLLRKQ